MMKRYDPAMYEQINEWFKDHKGDSIPEAMIPKVGFYVPGVAAGFLINTDTPICFLEPFISNPKAPKELRSKALEGIVECLEAEAVKLGYRYVYGISTAPTMLNLVKSKGWVDLGSQTVVAKELP